MLDAFFARYAADYAYAKPGRAWCYEDGCVYRGLLELYRATGDGVWHDHLERLMFEQVAPDGTLLGYELDSYNIDNILTGRLLFHLAASGDSRYEKAADLLAAQLASHPRIPAGNYWHKQIYPHQVWLDGLYMGLPFQIEYGLRRHRPELIEDAIDQLLGAVAIMYDPRTGLYFHGYDDSRSMPWADPRTGLSRGLWGRAVGWLAMALADVVDLLPATHPRRAEVLGIALSLADTLLGLRTADGLWLQVLDQPDLPGNFQETSASAMFAYFLLRTARLARSHPGLAEAGLEALETTVRLYLRPRGDTLELVNICEVAGLGPYRGRDRDGTPEYYVTEETVADDPKGVGPLMMARAEELLIEGAESRRRRAGS